MVGDYFSRMATAQKESPAQQQQSVQNGMLTPNMAKDAAQSQPQAAPQQQQQGQQPPVADQIMQEADQVMAPEKLLRQIDQLKSEIPQLQEAIQSGKLQAYEGIPLLKDKVATLKELEAQINPPQGVTQLASNLPQTPAGYAAGGVIAFAGNTDGSYVDDEEDDDIKYGGMTKQEEAMMAQYLADMEAGPEEGAEQGIAAMVPQAGKSQERFAFNPEKKGASEGIQYTDKKHKYETEIRDAAKQAGIPESLFLHMMAKETGGLSNPEAAISKAGARGIAQFMPATAKQYGIDPMDMNQALPAAAKMTGSLLKHYNGDERLAAMAYNWGQGNVDKWLASGADPAKVPKETSGYIRAAQGGIMGLASGGVIAFEEGGKAEEQAKNDREDFMLGLKKLGSAAADVVTLPVRGAMGAANTGIRGIRAMGLDVPYIPEEAFGGSSASMTPYYDRVVRAKEKASETTKPQFSVQPSGQETGPTRKELGLPEADMRTDAEKAAAESEATYKKDVAKSDEEITSLKDMLKERQASAKNQKEIDAYMALLQAGLGMMGGTSPYASVNIGKGASTGIEAALASRKNQISEENAILSGRLGLSRAELFEKSRQNALARQIQNDRNTAAYKKDMYSLGVRKAGAQEQTNALKARKQYMDENGEQILRKQYEDKYGKNFSVDPKLNFQFQQEMRSQISNLANIAGGEEDTSGTKSSTQ